MVASEPPAPIKELSLKKNVAWGMLGNVIFSLTQWGIVAVVARLGTPEQVGAITIATALVTPIFFLAAMSMREGHAVDDLTDFERRDYFALRLVASLLAMALIGAFTLSVYGNEPFMVQAAILTFMVVKFVGTQSNMNYGIFQREQRLDFVAKSFAVRGIMGLSGFALVFWLTGSLWLAFLTEAAMWFAAIALVDRLFLMRLGVTDRLSGILQVPPMKILKLFLWMLPLGLSGFLINATSSAPRLVLAEYVDLATLGVFGAIAYINTAFAAGTNAIGAASASRLRRLVRDGKRWRFLRLSFKLVAFSCFLGALIVGGSWLLGEWALRILYGEAYVRLDLLLIVMTATAIRVGLAPLQFAITAGQAFWRRFGINLVAFVATVGAAVLMIPAMGAAGAGWAMVTGSVVRGALSLVALLVLARGIRPGGTQTDTFPAENGPD